LFSANYKYWGFSTWNATGGYDVIWYNLVGNQIFGARLVTRFALDSIVGPVAGGAFVDPPDDPPAASVFDILWTDNDFVVDMPTPDIPDLMTTFCDPADPACSPDIIPPEITAMCPDCSGFGAPVPEPTTLALLSTGILGLAIMRRRKPLRKDGVSHRFGPRAAVLLAAIAVVVSSGKPTWGADVTITVGKPLAPDRSA
jgi:PEP-CTERM motif